MEALTNLLSWWHAAATAISYFSLAFYRLTLHPLARFPGPKLVTISRYYEAYYDVVRNGQYTFKIRELHKIYGPMIRTSPYELQLSGPAFFEKLYRQDAQYDKYAWTTDAFDAKGATLFTAPHDVHKARHLLLNPFLTKTKVVGRQGLIHRHLDKLCQRISKFADAGTTFDFGAATTAFARNVANEFILNKSYDSLDREDFDVTMLAASALSRQIWRLFKHVRWVAPVFEKIPIPWLLKHAGEDMKIFFRRLLETQRDTKKLMAAVASSVPGEDTPRTIVHKIIDSKLPPSENTFERVVEDVATVTGAEFETTSSSTPAELASANASSFSPLDLRNLEKLPYLTTILMEGLRLSPAIATCMACMAPDTGLVYERWGIPPGTPLYLELQRFSPDRWMHLDSRKNADKTFAPFSRGTRNCLGM
ncbi:cytochrome P450 [Lentithecium fluviatile CBS 122367]|uniref:Cytochrome P450 n=1 Tax=Lentithecium fluviatile CBS 122367 TaxID=1168545 RepID=A0A6G1IZ15_9PLEO|nr:cytochrome P450 [Lentithecium fluviatile CBS 122367]